MFQRLLAELGQIGRMYFAGLLFLAVGISLHQGFGAGFITIGVGALVYCVVRAIGEL